MRFCRGRDGARLAWAIHGSGPPVIVVSCWLSHLQHDWRSPVWHHFLRDLGEFATIVRYDERGFGMSDWNVTDFSLEARHEDLEALVEATGTATLANGRARLSAGPFDWNADLPAAICGTNLAPSPTAYLLGALAGCGVAFLYDTVAPQFGVRIDAITAVARSSTDLRGLLGIGDSSPELGDIALDIQITTSDGDDKTGPMSDAWREHCPIFLALLRPRTVSLTWRLSSTIGGRIRRPTIRRRAMPARSSSRAWSPRRSGRSARAPSTTSEASHGAEDDGGGDRYGEDRRRAE